MFARIAWIGLLFSVVVALPETVKAQCPLCNNTGDCADCEGACKCCRARRIRIVIKRPCMVAPAPVGFAVSSVPTIMVSGPTVALTGAPVSAGAAAASASASDLAKQIVDELRRQNSAAAGVAPAAAATATTCPDACGDIKQLQQDVRDLVTQMNRLGVQVSKLSADYKERKDKEQPGG